MLLRRAEGQYNQRIVSASGTFDSDDPTGTVHNLRNSEKPVFSYRWTCMQIVPAVYRPACCPRYELYTTYSIIMTFLKYDHLWVGWKRPGVVFLLTVRVSDQFIDMLLLALKFTLLLEVSPLQLQVQSKSY